MPRDWYHVRFRAKLTLDAVQREDLTLLNGPESDCSDCIQENDPLAKDLQRVHAWIAVGTTSRPLILYDVTGKSDGKMSLKVYWDVILEPVAHSRCGC